MNGKTFNLRLDIKPGVPNANGRIYSEEAIDNMIKRTSEKEVYIYRGTPVSPERQLAEICGVVRTIERDEENTKAKFQTLDNAHDITSLFEAGLLEIAPGGRGSVDTQGNITNYELLEFTVVFKQPKDPELNEAVVIISEALNARTATILFKPHERGAIFAQYDKAASDGAAGYWLTYDPNTQCVKINPGGKKINMFNPSSVDKVVQELEELRTPSKCIL